MPETGQILLRCGSLRIRGRSEQFLEPLTEARRRAQLQILVAAHELGKASHLEPQVVCLRREGPRALLESPLILAESATFASSDRRVSEGVPCSAPKPTTGDEQPERRQRDPARHRKLLLHA